jgi:hypothetical protein
MELVDSTHPQVLIALELAACGGELRSAAV